MTQSELAAQLEQSPAILMGLGLFLGCSLLALLTLTIWLSQRRRRGDAPAWNRVPALPVPGTEILAFFLLLILLAMINPLRPLVIPLTVAGVVWLTVKARRGQMAGQALREQWGTRRLALPAVGALSIWICLAAFAIIMPAAAVVQNALRAMGYEPQVQPQVQMFLSADSPVEMAFLLVQAVILAPVIEELLFRGLLQPVLKVRLGAWGSVLLAAALFSLVHFHAESFVQLMLLGIIMGVAYEATGSLLLAMGIHATFNTLQATLMLSLAPMLK